MPKPNYSYEKRQKDLAKKKKQDEKRARRLDRSRGGSDAGEDQIQDPAAESTTDTPAPSADEA